MLNDPLPGEPKPKAKFNPALDAAGDSGFMDLPGRVRSA